MPSVIELAAASAPAITPIGSADTAPSSDLLGTLSIIGTNVLNVMFLVGGILAVLYVVWAGYQYVTAGGDADKVKKARAGIVNGVIGVIIIMSAFFIVRFAVGIGKVVQNADQKGATTGASSNGGNGAGGTTGSTGGGAGAPSGLSGSTVGSNVSLSWAAVPGVSTYNVYRGSTPGGEGQSPVGALVLGTTYLDSGLTNGATYYYQVAAVGAGAKEGARSAEFSVTVGGTGGGTSGTTGSGLLPAPSGVAATAAGSGITVSWSAVAGAVGYTVYRGTTPDYLQFLNYVTGGTSYADTTAAKGTTYYYALTAQSSDGPGPRSGAVSAVAP